MSPRVVQILVVFVGITIGIEGYHAFEFYQRNSEDKSLNERRAKLIADDEAFLAQKKHDHAQAMLKWYENESKKAEDILGWRTTEKKQDEAFKDSVRHGYYIHLDIQQQSIFFQFESWLTKIPEVPGPIFALFVIMSAWIGKWLAKRYVESQKQLSEARQRESDILKEALPLFASVKAYLEMTLHRDR